jgi:hypothetical protein
MQFIVARLIAQFVSNPLRIARAGAFPKKLFNFRLFVQTFLAQGVAGTHANTYDQYKKFAQHFRYR